MSQGEKRLRVVRPKSYRVREIPTRYDEDILYSAIRDALKLSPETTLTIHSLATDYDFGAQEASRTATITITFGADTRPEDQKVPPFACLEDDAQPWPVELLFDTQFSGLTPLSPWKNDSKHTAICVAVHGWGGHALGSFQAERDTFLWLRDRIPHLFPELQVWTFGYGSRLQDEEAIQDLFGYSSELESAVMNLFELLKKSKPNIPLIFVAHSLGGMVVKQAIVDLSHSSKASEVLPSIYGAFFFGVPVQGMNTSAHATLVGESPQRFNLAILDSQVGSFLRQKLHDEFCAAFPFKDSKIYQFYEALQTRTVVQNPETGVWTNNGPLQLLVTRDSALSGRPWEKSSEYVVELKADHRTIVKFRREDRDLISPVLKRFREVLQLCKNVVVRRKPDKNKLTEDHEQEVTKNLEEGEKSDLLVANRTECFNSLSFEQLGSRLSNIENAHILTCQWLFEDTTFKRWWTGESPHKFLWIKGNPGAGKSTLMKEAFSYAQSNSQGHVISFFFHARGAQLEKTLVGLFRSLVCQLSRLIPALNKRVLEVFRQKQQIRRTRVEWSVQDLKAILTLACRDGLLKNCIVFIDALDEGKDEEVRDMLSYFRQISSVPQSDMRICLASRYYPHISFLYCEDLPIEARKGHAVDIEKYVESQISLDRAHPKASSIISEIIQKSKGVFLWVVLVVRKLNIAADSGRVSHMEKLLAETPSELSALSADVLQKSEHNITETCLLLKWILFAARPLTPQELYFAVNASLYSTYEADSAISGADVKRFILDCSRGMVEIVSQVAKDAEKTLVTDELKESSTGLFSVQFIHASVQDFLLRGDYLLKLENAFQENPLEAVQEELKLKCLDYMQAVTAKTTDLYWGRNYFQREAKEKQFPFLSYCYHNIFHHAEAAARNISQSTFAERFANRIEPVSRSYFAYIAFSERFEDALGMDLLLLLCQQGFAELSKLRLQSFTVSVNSIDSGGRTALYYAVKHGLTGVVSSLVQRIDLELNLSGEQLNYVLIEMVRSNQFKILRLLLKESVADAATIDLAASAALIEAAELNMLDCALALLERSGVDVNAADHNGKTALIKAAEHDSEDCVRLLLSRSGVQVNIADYTGETALIEAASRGRAKCLRLLLDAPGIDVNIVSHNGSTALIESGLNGHVSCLRMLLEAGGTQINAFSPYGDLAFVKFARNSLLLCLKEMLKRPELDINLATKYGSTALTEAVRARSVPCVELLLEREGINVNAVTSDGQTALMTAVWSGEVPLVQLLCKRADLDVNYGSGKKTTALILAVEKKAMDSLGVLLSREDLDVNAPLSSRETALIRACRNGDLVSVEHLLQRSDININAIMRRNGPHNEHYQSSKEKELPATAFDFAREASHTQILELLLKKGAVSATKSSEWVKGVDRSDTYGRVKLVEPGAGLKAEGTSLALKRSLMPNLPDDASTDPSDSTEPDSKRIRS